MYYIYYKYNNHIKYSQILNYKPNNITLSKLIDPKDEQFSITIIKLY